MTELIDAPPEADEFTCPCGVTAHPEDAITVGDERRCDACSTVCDDCGDGVPRGDTLIDHSGVYCDECRTSCGHCGDLVRPAEAVDGAYCTDCRFVCEDCGRTRDADEVAVSSDWNNNRWCTGCAYYCERCDEYSVGSTCDNDCYSGSIRGLKDYGHTYPQHWLGGPLPRVNGRHDGYYMGFELEITASSGDATRIDSWACSALGNADVFESKEDSSVEGFEIASQPMTREYVEKVLAPTLPQFFEMLDREFGSPAYNDEPDDHGLHVHISRTAFRDNKGNDSPTMLAAFCRILAADDGTHLERIGRRHATEYCRKVDKPVSSALMNASDAWSVRRERRFDAEVQRQLKIREESHPGDSNNYYYANQNARQIVGTDMYLNRGAINLNNGSTVEIRSFKSTRKPENLLAALRLVSDVADYVRWLMRNRKSMSATTASWSAFCRWVAVHDPDMFDIVTGLRALD